MAPRKTEAQVTSLRRLILANFAFTQAGDSVRFLRAVAVDPLSGQYLTMLTGICSGYMQPFIHDEGCGVLSSTYAHFPADTEFAQTHEELKTGWSRSVASQASASAAKSLRDKNAGKDQRPISLRLQNGGWNFKVAPVSWQSPNLHRIQQLCDYQRIRIRDELNPLLASMVKGKEYLPEATYILGETFPDAADDE
ncbi:MAG: hypothetical protein JWM32_2045 [Verrucomicrobia bacterium]|nr:hypothetical protein [Verrucomicrobiota bacterium]